MSGLARVCSSGLLRASTFLQGELPACRGYPQELRRHLRQADVPTIKALTMALKAQGFHHGAWVGQRGWYARRRSEE